MAPPSLNFEEIKLITLRKGKDFKIETNKDHVWKIESVGIGGPTGTVFLIEALPEGAEPIAILYSADNRQGAQLPLWLRSEFAGAILNDSSYTVCISVTVYSTVAPS